MREKKRQRQRKRDRKTERQRDRERDRERACFPPANQRLPVMIGRWM